MKTCEISARFHQWEICPEPQSGNVLEESVNVSRFVFLKPKGLLSSTFSSLSFRLCSSCLLVVTTTKSNDHLDANH